MIERRFAPCQHQNDVGHPRQCLRRESLMKNAVSIEGLTNDALVLRLTRR